MAQSLFDDAGPVAGAAIGLADRVEGLQGELATVTERLEQIESLQGKALERVKADQAAAVVQASALTATAEKLAREMGLIRWVAVAALIAALAGIAATLALR
jgi:hypothetical protein